jgi:hypothetical protein
MRLTLYSRMDCGLCAEKLDALAAYQADRNCDLGVDIVDVDSDPALARRYGDRVPVLLADGEFLCAYRLDAGRLDGALGAG